MHLATQSSSQVHTLFGGAYVSEQHGEETCRHLPPLEDDDRVVDFAEVLKTLRTALSIG
jgi:hypothetical protein